MLQPREVRARRALRRLLLAERMDPDGVTARLLVTQAATVLREGPPEPPSWQELHRAGLLATPLPAFAAGYVP